MNPDDLERLIDGELKRLPAARAPRTLLPRVLSATVQRRPAPWYARPWLTWPAAWRAASLVAVAGGAAATMLARSWLPASAEGPGPLATLLDTLDTASAVVRVSWRVLLEPLAFSVVAATLVLSLACAALWSVLNRFALGGVSEP
jgi:hypothetical protein